MVAMTTHIKMAILTSEYILKLVLGALESLPLSNDLPGPSGLQSTHLATSGPQASQDIIDQYMPSQTDVCCPEVHTITL